VLEQRLVAPQRHDQRCAGRIGARRDLAHERRRFECDAAVGERPDDQEALARPQIQADAHGEIGISAKHGLKVCAHRFVIVRL